MIGIQWLVGLPIWLCMLGGLLHSDSPAPRPGGKEDNKKREKSDSH